MRAYFFGNMYLSSIQQGIQAQHCTTNMFKKYLPRPDVAGECCFDASEQSVQLMEWAHDHETDILLNGGYSSNLREIGTALDDTENQYPWSFFNEGYEALDGALTCVGIILPEEIYETASAVRSARGNSGRDKVANFNEYGEWEDDDTGEKFTFTKFQVWLINELNKYGLAK